MAAVPAEVAAALVSWDHSGEYPLPNEWLSGGGAGFTKTFKLNDEEHAFIADHNVDSRILMPVRTHAQAQMSSLPTETLKELHTCCICCTSVVSLPRSRVDTPRGSPQVGCDSGGTPGHLPDQQQED